MDRPILHSSQHKQGSSSNFLTVRLSFLFFFFNIFVELLIFLQTTTQKILHFTVFWQTCFAIHFTLVSRETVYCSSDTARLCWVTDEKTIHQMKIPQISLFRLNTHIDTHNESSADNLSKMQNYFSCLESPTEQCCSTDSALPGGVTCPHVLQKSPVCPQL